MTPYQKLEKEYAGFTGSKYAVSCSSGTAGLHLALLALHIGNRDEVIVPDFAMAACAFSVSYCGAKPVFVDVNENYALAPSLVEKAITSKTKAVMLVHTYGRLGDTDVIVKIAKRHGISVIEDACEAQGAVFKSKADITVYSFFKNKIIHAEEGGMITTNKKDLADRANYLKNMAFGPEHDYFHTEVGYNYRLPNAQALLALQSLKSYESNNKKRRRIEAWYASNLFTKMKKRDAVWFYEVFVPSESKKSILKKIPSARDCFKPLSSFPMYGSRKGHTVSSRLAQSLILLPASPNITESDVKKICEVVNTDLPTMSNLSSSRRSIKKPRA